MKKGICIAVILLFSTSVFAHPGKTDRFGGHKCRKSCGEWDLLYDEYHLHDKDWKPIRVNAKGEPIPNEPPRHDVTPVQEPQEKTEPPQTEQTAVRSFGEGAPEKPERKIVNEYHHITVVREEDIFSLNNILLLFLAFLLLSALIFIRQKRGKD